MQKINAKGEGRKKSSSGRDNNNEDARDGHGASDGVGRKRKKGDPGGKVQSHADGTDRRETGVRNEYRGALAREGTDENEKRPGGARELGVDGTTGSG